MLFIKSIFWKFSIINMTIADLKNKDLLFFEAISGSRAYGTQLPTSDTDHRGVFFLPHEAFYGLDHTVQVSDESNDNVYYELGRFVELLAKSNPNMLEMLNMPEDCILYQHPLFEKLQPELFLSKQCQHTFAGYAMTQVRKAKGLNKKIHNPLPRERKSILDFCYIIEGYGSIPLKKWLDKNEVNQKNCGMISIPHFQDAYAVFHDPTGTVGLRGIMHKPNANEVALSSIPKGMKEVAILSFNKNGYQTYCKDYRQYWDWVEKRNEHRYENTLAHGKNYDAKNMMHTFRLLDMAEDIAREGVIGVRRPNRDFLLEIRSGKYEYDQLLKWAEEKIKKIDALYKNSKLPDQPDLVKINHLLVEIRKNFYD